MPKHQSNNSDGSTSENETPQKKSMLRKLFWCVQWFINLCVLGIILIIFTPAGKWAEDKMVSVDKLGKADYIVVLGGDIERTIEAARLYSLGWAPKVIVTSTGSNADDMAALAVEFGVKKEDIIVEPNSKRTANHPEAVAKLPGVDKKKQRFIILTSYLHSGRARRCFENDGYRKIMVVTPAWRYGGKMGLEKDGWYHRLRNIPAMARETVGWGLYKTMGWL